MNDEYLFVLDIGNTHVVVGIYSEDKLIIRRRLATKSGRTADEAWIMVKMLCLDAGIDPAHIKDVAIASVAPKATTVYGQMSEMYLNRKPFYIRGNTTGFVNKYKNPMAVGADRACNAVAGYAKYGGPLLIVDFGTAVTIDVVDYDGAYLGGVILPGLETSSEALHAKAALLPTVRLEMAETAIGKTTDESIRAGIMNGTAYALKGLIQKITEEMGYEEIKVVATGGMARIMAPYIEEIIAIEHDLVLEGIRIFYNRNSQ